MSKKITTEIMLDRVKQSNPEMFEKYDYSNTRYVNGNQKISVVCPEHGEFLVWPRDHMRGMSGCKKCIVQKRKETNIKKYGVDNYFKRVDLIQKAMLKAHGVRNPGLLPDHIDKVKKTNLEKYGVEWATSTEESKSRRKKTNLERYNVDCPMKDEKIKKKMMETKIKNGSFSKSNSSNSASNFIFEYVKYKNYDMKQCCFDWSDEGLHEWGTYYKGRWRLFDLVVFELGHRGDKDKILEILEYHGPFHYTEEDVQSRGNEQAYPWKSNKTTIKESFDTDKIKEELALSLTKNYNVIWENMIDPNDVIVENVKKLESRYPGGSFDVHYSENRKEGDL